MLPVLFAAIVFAFLLLGSLVYLTCVVVPPTRRCIERGIVVCDVGPLFSWVDNTGWARASSPSVHNECWGCAIFSYPETISVRLGLSAVSKA